MLSASLLDAARQGRADELEHLLRLGASVNEQDYDSAGSALYWACCSGSDEAVRLLLDAGGEVNTPNAHRHSPLHAAADRGHSKIVQLLLQSGASVNARNSEGLTPLHLAAYRGYSAIVDLLLRSGADMRIRSNDNKTAFHEARAQKHLEVIEAMRHFELQPSNSTFTTSSACIRHHSSLCNVAHSAFDDASGPKQRSGWKPELKKSSQHRAQPLKKTMSTPPLPCLLTREALPAKRDFAKVSIDPLDDEQDDHDDGVSVLLGNGLVSLGMTSAISLIDLLPLYPRNPPRAADATAAANATAAIAIPATAATSGATDGRRAMSDQLYGADAPAMAVRRTCTRSLSAHGGTSSHPSGVRCQHTVAKNCTVFCECRLSTSSDELTASSRATALVAGSDVFDARRNRKPATTAAVADCTSTASTRFTADCRANAVDEEQALSAVIRQDVLFCREKLSGTFSLGADNAAAKVDAFATAEAAAASAAAGWTIADGFGAEPQWNISGSTESVLSFDDADHCKQALRHLEGHLMQADEVMRDRTVSAQLHRSVSMGDEPTGDPAQRQPGLRRSSRAPGRSPEGLLTVGPCQKPAVSAVLPPVSQQFQAAAADLTALADDDFAFRQCGTPPRHDTTAAVDSSTESDELPLLSDCEAAASVAHTSAASWLSVGVSYSLVDGEPFAVVRERSGATQLLFRIASVLSFAYTLKVILDLDRKLLVLSDTAGCTASVAGGVCGLQVPSVPPHPHVARILASYCGDGSNFARLPLPRCRGSSSSSQTAVGECRAGGGRRSSESDDFAVYLSSCDESAGSLLTDDNDTAETRLDSCHQPTAWPPQAGRRIPALFYVMPGGYVHTLSSFIRWSRGTQPSPPYGVDVRVYLRIVYEVLSAAVHLRQTASLCHCAVTPDAIYLTADLHAAVGDVEACVCLRAIDGSLVACDEEALLRGTSRSGNVDYYWWAPELERHVLRSRIGRPSNQPTYAHVLHEKCDTYSIGRTMYAVMGTYSSTESVRAPASTSAIAFPAISRAKLCYSDDETPDLIDGCINNGCYPPNLRALLRCLVRDAASRPTAAEALAWTAKELSSTCSTAALNAADAQMSKIGRYAKTDASVRQSSAC